MQVYDLAHQLARELTQTKEYQDLIKLRDKVQEVEANREMLANFQEKHNAILEVQMAGDTPAPEKVAELEKLAEVMMLNPAIHDYHQAEIQLVRILGDVEKIIREAINPALVMKEEQA